MQWAKKHVKTEEKNFPICYYFQYVCAYVLSLDAA